MSELVSIELTQNYLNNRNKHIQEKWYGGKGLLAFISPIESLRLNRFSELMKTDFEFSASSQSFLNKMIEEKSLKRNDIEKWILNIEHHLIKLKERIYFLIILSLIIAVTIPSLIALFSERKYMEFFYVIPLLFTIIFSFERIASKRIISGLEELLFFLKYSLKGPSLSSKKI